MILLKGDCDHSKLLSFAGGQVSKTPFQNRGFGSQKLLKMSERRQNQRTLANLENI